jgi:hypothetical protein
VGGTDVRRMRWHRHGVVLSRRLPRVPVHVPRLQRARTRTVMSMPWWFWFIPASMPVIFIGLAVWVQRQKRKDTDDDA